MIKWKTEEKRGRDTEMNGVKTRKIQETGKERLGNSKTEGKEKVEN